MNKVLRVSDNISHSKRLEFMPLLITDETFDKKKKKKLA